MTEEKTEGGCCSTSKGCGCCKGLKLLVMLLFAAFIFASGMWYGKAHCHCHMMGGGNYCPFSAPAPK